MLRGMQRAGWKAVVAMSAALLLAGCAETPAPAVRTATPSATASASGASSLTLAAATTFYRSYLKEDNRVLQAGGKGYEALHAYLAEEPYAAAVRNFKQLAAAHERVEGGAVLANAVLQRASAQGLSAYMCIDISKARVLDSDGEDVTPKTRPNRQTLLVAFSGAVGDIEIKSSRPWSGSSIC